MSTTHLDSPKNSSQHSSPSSPSRPRQSRIHFPIDPSSTPSPTFKTLEARGSRDTHPSGPSRPFSLDAGDSFVQRRRVRSAVDALDSGAYSRSQVIAGPSPRSGSRRTASHHTTNDHLRTPKGENVTLPPVSPTNDFIGPDEQTEDKDDPDILADLQRALQIKSRVEQQIKAAKSTTELSSSDRLSLSTPSNPFLKSSGREQDINIFRRSNLESVDFSPSVGKTPDHPVPTSSNDGATLDWSGISSGDERRERKWSMPLTRRASKDKHTSSIRKVIVEKQESLYFDKLARIRNKATLMTLRKAEITKSQFDRRYVAIATCAGEGKQLNLLDVIRWFTTQDFSTKQRISREEPLFWLRHLLHGKIDDPHTRAQWHLSALIVEEYIWSRVLSHERLTALNQTQSGVEALSDVGSLFSNRVRSATRSLDLSSMRRKSDDLISFEPIVAGSRRNSLVNDSHDAHAEVQHRPLLNSISKAVDVSPKSSSQGHSQEVNEGQQEPQQAPEHLKVQTQDPTPSRPAIAGGRKSPLQSFNLARRSRRTNLRSDEEHSSPVESVSESHKASGSQIPLGRRHGRFTLSLDTKVARESSEDARRHRRTQALSISGLRLSDLRTDASTGPTETHPLKTLSLPGEGGNKGDSLELKRNLTQPQSLQSYQKAARRRIRTSLPTSLQSSVGKMNNSAQKTEVREHALSVEYARKKESLDALKARNIRMKMLLQSASKTIADYDETQSHMAESLNLNYSRLPADILNAFIQDSGSLSSGGRKEDSIWKNAEENFGRRKRQVEVLETFTLSVSERIRPSLLPEEGIFEQQMDSLSNMLEELHQQRVIVLSRVRQTGELLKEVKKLRDDLKPEYDAAGKYTSANYPELVRLETLLDEFVNKRNQLWKIGETSLSLALSSLAPFMKTFGRPIWNDLHDFLVIPVYRNDFSGEDEWYPVTFPRRTPFHWLRLFTFAICAPLFFSSGFRLFINLLTRGLRLHIPSLIPWLLVYSSISCIAFAFALTLVGLFITVLCEFAIIFWWTAWAFNMVI